MLGLHQRQLIPELMDQPGLDDAEHHRALRALSRINRISNSAGIMYRPIRALARRHAGPEPLRVLDIACGGADVTTTCAAWAKAEGLPVVFEGCDMSETALALARRNAEARGVDMTFFRHNVIEKAFEQPYDVMMCSLFLHHLENDEARNLLQNMELSTKKLLLVNDLIRSQMGYFLAHFAGNVFTQSHVVRFDAPASVRGAFTMDEAKDLAEQAGLTGAAIRWHWPWRFLLSWTRRDE